MSGQYGFGFCFPRPVCGDWCDGNRGLKPRGKIGIFCGEKQEDSCPDRQNLVSCKLREKAKIYTMDALKAVTYLQRQEPGLRFDLVYLDPRV